jgi:hypothetical protein
MEILKTWLVVVGALALGFVSLLWVQTRNTLALREAEIVRLRQERPAEEARVSTSPAPAAIALPAASSSSAAPAGDSGSAAVEALVAMTADRDRYKDGLYKCVEEANRAAQGSGRRFELPGFPSLPSGPAAPSAEAHISMLYSEPTVTPLGDRMQVSGKLFNTGKASGSVTAVITLLRDGKAVTSAREVVMVPAQGQAGFSHVFPWGGQEGAWTARAVVE